MNADTPKPTLDLKNVPSWDEVRKLVFASKPYMKTRKWLYLALLAFTGARRNEILLLKTSDMVWENGKVVAVKIGQLKKKAPMTRKVPVSESIEGVLASYILNLKSDRLFDFTYRTANNIVERASKQALGRKITPKDLRHAFAYKILEQTEFNLEAARRMLGHSGYDTLRIYLSTTQMDLKKDIDEITHAEPVANSK